MFIEGDIFKIEEIEYRLRVINKYLTCWLEPVLYRDKYQCITGGLNRIFHMDELMSLKYLEITH